MCWREIIKSTSLRPIDQSEQRSRNVERSKLASGPNLAERIVQSHEQRFGQSRVRHIGPVGIVRVKKGDSLPQFLRAVRPMEDIESLTPDRIGDRVGDERRIRVAHGSAGELDCSEPTHPIRPDAFFTPFDLLFVDDLIGERDLDVVFIECGGEPNAGLRSTAIRLRNNNERRLAKRIPLREDGSCSVPKNVPGQLSGTTARQAFRVCQREYPAHGRCIALN